MSRKTPINHLQSCRAAFLACLLPLVAGNALAQSPPAAQKLADLQADCRIEGEAGGLSAGELDQFIEDCVADLRTVEFSNPDE